MDDDKKKIDPKKKDRKSFKEFDPTKYIETEPTMTEAVKRTAVISFGRFNPITVGHEKLVNKVVSEAIKRKADPAIYMSHSQDAKKNPLSYEEKLSLAQKAFGKPVKKSTAKTIIEVSKELSGKYSDLVIVVGSDRVGEFETLLNRYNGKEFNFESISVISAGERDPDADDVTGMSASKMRSLAAQGNMEAFKNGLPSKLKSSAEKVYNLVRGGMNMSENINEETLSEAEPLTLAQRRKRGLVMKRYRTKIMAARERAKRKMAPKEKLLKRSRKRALEFIRDRLMKNKKYSEMTPAEKIALDKRVMKIPKAVISRIATKLLPQIRSAERERLQSVLSPNQDKNEMFEAFLDERTIKPQDKDVKHLPGSQPKGYYAGLDKDTKAARARHFATYSKKSDDEQSSYKPAPGDAEAKTKTSVHTKKFKQMFGESLQEASLADTKVRSRPHMALEKNGSVKFDKRFKMYKTKKDINESQEYIAEEVYELMNAMEDFVFSEEFDALMESDPSEGLKKKAEKSGISYGILKKVFDRGVAAWRTGHRPGTTPTQWGFARVNSFATKGKGTWGKADSDLAAKVRSEAVSPTAVHPFVHTKTPDKSVKVSKGLKHKLGIGLSAAQMGQHAMKSIDLDVDGDIDRFEKGTPDEITGTEKKNMTRVMQKKLSGEVKHTRIGHAFENVETSKMKMKIAQEKEADARKHDRMLDAAKSRDAAAKKSLTKSISEGNPDPSKREQGTDSVVKTYKKDTPGQKSLKEFMLTDTYGPFKRGDTVRFNRHSMDMFDGAARMGTVIGGDVAWLRVRDEDGKLFKVRHYDAALSDGDVIQDVLEATAMGFEGKKIKIKNVAIRMADGTMRKMPPGKSSSSDGGDGNGGE
jgi:nicotinic acid mononucleotide adenylyltransferase